MKSLARVSATEFVPALSEPGPQTLAGHYCRLTALATFSTWSTLKEAKSLFSSL